MANTAQVNTTFKIERRFGFFNAAFTIAFCIAMVCLFATTDTFAKDYSFTWSANPEPVEGYKLYYKKGGEPVAPFDGTGAIQGPSPITIGKLTTTFTISGLDENTTYYFALTAVNGTEESGYSNIVAVNATSTDTTLPTPVLLTAVITTPSQTGVAPFILTFDGTQSTGSITSYAWSFGDGNTAIGATATHTYQAAGTYTATLAVKDASGLIQQSSVSITVTATTTSPTVPAVPPTAVGTASVTVGEAPLSVNFDGSGSSSAQPPMVSYSWDFGDGSHAEGDIVEHTFTTAGEYTTILTVTDSAGLTNQTSFPVIISAPTTVVGTPTGAIIDSTVAANQKPVASFTATPTTGQAPLIVDLDASGSSDPDGSITSYVWNFGDGTSASGPTARHTFNAIADHMVTLTVTDDKGETAVTSQTISVLGINFELQEVQADYNWKTVTFSQPFVDPVVVAGPPSFADAKPATLRIRNVTSTGCEVRVDEYEYLRDRHATETFGILIMEKGVYELDNGAKLEAGTFTGSTSFQKVVFQQTYNVVPVVLTQVLTYNEASAVTGRVRNSGVGSFDYALQEMEKNKVFHKAETVGYIAWEPGTGTYAGLLYEVGVTAQSVTDNWSEITFQNEFPSMPLFIAGMQTAAEADTAAVRRQSVSTTTAQIKIEEETSKDAETSHAPEVVGYITIGSMP
ncbi:MAG: PKD domain-containing protein [Desulfoprunum sp.]